jgi:coenzyme F420-reducing hydrogenase delta subunit
MMKSKNPSVEKEPISTNEIEKIHEEISRMLQEITEIKRILKDSY